MKAEKQKQSFCRQHWCLCIYIFLAVLGVVVPAYKYLQPCEDELSTYIQPADVFVLMDASKSLVEKSWEGEKSAALEILGQLHDEVSDLQVGFLTFTGHWETNPRKPILRDITNLGTSYDKVVEGVNALGDTSYLQLGTNFHEPLMECKTQMADFGRQHSYKLCILMTDGQDMSNSYTGRLGPCSRGCSDPLESADEVKVFNDTEILAIYAPNPRTPEWRRNRGRDTLYDMSSCRDYNMTRETCTYFTQVYDFPDLHAKTENITAKIVDEITRQHVKCVKGPWLGFLLLLVPLLVMLLLPHCLRCAGGMRKVKKVRIINDAPKVPPPPPAPYNPSMTSAPAAGPPMEKKVKKAFKWEVDTGKYIRSTGNIRPDWGANGFVPESAPTQGPRRKITVSEGEDADGYEYEYVEVEQTLEEWAEERMSGAASRLCIACYWFWCCCGFCPCYKNEEDDEMDIKLLAPDEAIEP